MARSKRKEFEGREVYAKKGLKNALRPTGYDAIRVSPRTTSKFGKKYKKIYGATIEPDYLRGKSGKYGAKVSWFRHGFTKASVKSGTRLLQTLRGYPVSQSEVKSKLMVRARKPKTRKASVKAKPKKYYISKHFI